DPATPVGGSLLSELEFQAILTAGCHRLNPLYSDCTATAYDTSREHHGEGCRRPLPEACSPGHPGWIHGASKK
ncbi:MAG: hypothetical protein ACXVBW_08045, partial [Bdellovibrionota bacterium]